MKLHYYPETDSLYIELKPGPGAETREVAAGLNVDFDATGEVVGFDIDHASRKLDLTTLETIELPVRAAGWSRAAFERPRHKALGARIAEQVKQRHRNPRTTAAASIPPRRGNDLISKSDDQALAAFDRPLPLRTPPFRPNWPSPDLFRQSRSLRRVVGRDHGIVGRQLPFFAILLWRQAKPRKVTPQRLEPSAILQTDQKIRGDRPADRNRGRFRLELRRGALRRGCEPRHDRVRSVKNQSGAVRPSARNCSRQTPPPFLRPARSDLKFPWRNSIGKSTRPSNTFTPGLPVGR